MGGGFCINVCIMAFEEQRKWIRVFFTFSMMHTNLNDCVNSDSINKFKSSLKDAWKDHTQKFSCV